MDLQNSSKTKENQFLLDSQEKDSLITKPRQELTELTTQQSQLQSSFDTKVDDLAAEVHRNKSLTERLTSKDDELQSYKLTIEQLEVKMSVLRVSYEETTASISALTATNNNLLDYNSKLQQAVDDSKASLNTSNSVNGNLKHQIAVLEQQNTSLNQAVHDSGTNLGQQLAAALQKISLLENQLADKAGECDHCRQAIGTTKTDLNTLLATSASKALLQTQQLAEQQEQVDNANAALAMKEAECSSYLLEIHRLSNEMIVVQTSPNDQLVQLVKQQNQIQEQETLLESTRMEFVASISTKDEEIVHLTSELEVTSTTKNVELGKLLTAIQVLEDSFKTQSDEASLLRKELDNTKKVESENRVARCFKIYKAIAKTKMTNLVPSEHSLLMRCAKNLPLLKLL